MALKIRRSNFKHIGVRGIPEIQAFLAPFLGSSYNEHPNVIVLMDDVLMASSYKSSMICYFHLFNKKGKR